MMIRKSDLRTPKCTCGTGFQPVSQPARCRSHTSAVLGALSYQALVGILALTGASCAHSRIRIDTVEAHDLEKLIWSSRSAERAQWWPSVEQLGKRTSIDEAIRDEIWARTRVNTVGMKFVEVQPGTFTMGPDEHRVVAILVAHPVEITKGYFISVTEVTNAQYRQLVPDFEPDARYSPYPDSPAVNISWEDADRFCKLLSQREGVFYRLPTEAEWEYACRAGSETLFCFGDDPGELAEYGWYDHAGGRASQVAILKPNAWGIYDMHGNAVEWVYDWYSTTYYVECAAEGVVQNPTGPEQGQSLPYLKPTHVLRGAGWIWSTRIPSACGSTARFPLPRLDRVPLSTEKVGFRQVIGFRVVRELVGARGRDKVTHD